MSTTIYLLRNCVMVSFIRLFVAQTDCNSLFQSSTTGTVNASSRPEIWKRVLPPDLEFALASLFRTGSSSIPAWTTLKTIRFAVYLIVIKILYYVIFVLYLYYLIVIKICEASSNYFKFWLTLVILFDLFLRF